MKILLHSLREKLPKSKKKEITYLIERLLKCLNQISAMKNNWPK